jgi:hypothetical protein
VVVGGGRSNSSSKHFELTFIILSNVVYYKPTTVH